MGLYEDAMPPCPNCGAEKWAGQPHQCPPGAPLTFAAVTEANVARSDRWHKDGEHKWSTADWAVAMMGEAGEACNAIKKLRRLEEGLSNISDPGRHLATREQALAAIGEELADTFLYLNLLANQLGINLADQIVAKFNSTSARYGFPERLPPNMSEDHPAWPG